MQQEKLVKVINLGGGTRYGVLSVAVTHVVVGEESSGKDKLLQSIRDMGDR